MKKLLKINSLTYFFIISASLCGMFKECLILFSIIIFHELGHVLMVKYLKYNVLSIEILPFGGITKIKKDINASINDEILISISGIFMQLILFVIVSFFYQNNLLNSSFYYVFNKYNFSILIFNLLPIIPLDGSIFFKSILYKKFSFFISNILSVIISFIFLSLFIYVNYIWKLNNYFICFFLFYKIIMFIKEYKYLENRFYLERHLKNYNFKRYEIISKMREMKMERSHYFKNNRKLESEKNRLNRYFCKS